MIKNKEDKEFEMLKSLRADIENNSSNYERSLKKAENVTQEELSKRWINSMINNNIAKVSKNESIKAVKLLLSFEDERVNKLMLEKMNCKKKVLQKDNKFEFIQSELTKKADKKFKNNSDVIRLLILKYAYYLRNKYFHAERIPAIFLIETSNKKELEYMSEFILAINLDLISNKLRK